MKLEKFDLEKALNGAKVVTRDGHEVTQLTKFESVNDDYPVIGVLDNNLQAWTTQGKFNTNHGESDADLFLAVEPQRVWVNVFTTITEKFMGLGGNFFREANKNLKR
jgi:hypothetical protein